MDRCAHRLDATLQLRDEDGGYSSKRGDGLPVDLRERVREVMTGNPVYRGDTENHWMMHTTARLLAAQLDDLDEEPGPVCGGMDPVWQADATGRE